MPWLTQDRVLGLIAIALGLFIALYWAEADSETWLIEKVRGRTAVGDALAPTVAAIIIIVGGLWLVLTGSGTGHLAPTNAGYLVALIACLGGSLALMRWGGPALVEAITGAEYRPQRDTVPWKYAGFLTGGTVMIVGLIFLVERRLHWSRIVIALGVSVLLALLYDLPFDDLILPPNGDV